MIRKQSYFIRAGFVFLFTIFFSYLINTRIYKTVNLQVILIETVFLRIGLDLYFFVWTFASSTSSLYEPSLVQLSRSM